MQDKQKPLQTSALLLKQQAVVLGVKSPREAAKRT